METIKVDLNVQVVNGPIKIVKTRNIKVEIYNKIEVLVESNRDKQVDVEVGRGVSFLLIQSDTYSGIPTTTLQNKDQLKTSEEKFLVYFINDQHSPIIILDKPNLYLSSDAINVLFNPELKTISFVNTLGRNAKIEVLVGRNIISIKNIIKDSN